MRGQTGSDGESAGSIRAASTRRGRPSVSVPVLSKATASISASRSMADPSLTMMPALNSRPAATTCTTGTASPSAQGQVMMSTAIATIIACFQSPS